MISTDKKIFDKNSPVRQRMIEYGKLAEELHIIVFSGRGYNEGNLSGNTYVYPTNSPNRWFYVFNASKIGKKIIDKLGAISKDIIITAQDPFESGFVAWLIAKKKKIRFQLQVHTDFLNQYFTHGSLINQVRVMLALFLVPKASCLRVVSQRIKTSIIRSFNINESKISVLPIFADLDAMRQSEIKTHLHKRYPQFEKIVLVASRLEKEKNIPLAISAFAKVIKKYPKAGMVIVGEGREKERLEKWVKEYGIQNSVLFEGWQDDLSGHYKTADLFVSTSNYEGYGLSILMAYALSCPILTTDVGLVGETIRYGDIGVCDVGDVGCFINKMISALSAGRKESPLSMSGVMDKKEKYLEEHKAQWEKCLV